MILKMISEGSSLFYVENSEDEGNSRDYSAPLPFLPMDLLFAAIFGCLAIAVATLGFSLTSQEHGLLEYKNIWFQADIARVIDNMTNLGGSHWRTSVHPITSILLYPAGFLLAESGFSTLQVGRAIVIAFCALNPALLFLVLRQLKMPREVAAVFTALFLASAAVIFWSSVVELYPIACFSLLPALYLMAYGRTSNRIWWVLASALTLSITVTNWSIGLIATFLRWRLRSFLFITFISLGIVLFLSLVQFFIFKDARIFIDPRGLKWDAVSFSEPVMQRRGLLSEGWHPLTNLEVLYVSAAVAPRARVEKQGQEYVATNQGDGFPCRTYSGPVASFAWVALLMLGAWGAVRNRRFRSFSLGLALMILGNGALHSVYGEVTFLYTMHTIPLLTILAAMSWFSPGRWIGIGLAAVVITAGGWNNWDELRRSAELAGQIGDMPGVSTIQAYP
ncbi:hypothetical protein LMIY3S_03522 [Labrys miyagiensis]